MKQNSPSLFNIFSFYSISQEKPFYMVAQVNLVCYDWSQMHFRCWRIQKFWVQMMVSSISQGSHFNFVFFKILWESTILSPLPDSWKNSLKIQYLGSMYLKVWQKINQVLCDSTFHDLNQIIFWATMPFYQFSLTFWYFCFLRMNIKDTKMVFSLRTRTLHFSYSAL